MLSLSFKKNEELRKKNHALIFVYKKFFLQANMTYTSRFSLFKSHFGRFSSISKKNLMLGSDL